MSITSTERRLLNWLTQSFFRVKINVKSQLHSLCRSKVGGVISNSDTVLYVPDFLLIITPDVTQMERKRTPVRPLAAATITIICHILSSTCPKVLLIVA